MCQKFFSRTAFHATLLLLFFSQYGNCTEESTLTVHMAMPAVHQLDISTHNLLMREGDNATILIKASSPLNTTIKNESSVDLIFVQSGSGEIEIEPGPEIEIDPENFQNATRTIRAVSRGKVVVRSYIVGTSNNYSSLNVFFEVNVFKYSALITISEIVGWIYFVAWSVSFYPQIYQNWRRKSVRGLSLDFVFLNWTGFAVYGMFNIGLYAVPFIRQEYLVRYPNALIPVQLNDVFFAVHALFAASVTCLQCICYDKGAQTVSKTGKTILLTIFAVIFVLLIVTVSRAIQWLDFLIACSTIKLIITLIKYVPQAYLNYARKSTSGWCIGNVLLDFTGGVLSVLQMLILAFNNDDWISLFGDYTKFGLGFFSILFDIFFIIQHYVLYRMDKNGNDEMIEGYERFDDDDGMVIILKTRSHEAYEPIAGTNIPSVIEDPEAMVTSNHIQTTDSEDAPSNNNSTEEG